jgi:hypothetical protein
VRRTKYNEDKDNKKEEDNAPLYRAGKSTRSAALAKSICILTYFSKNLKLAVCYKHKAPF